MIQVDSDFSCAIIMVIMRVYVSPKEQIPSCAGRGTKRSCCGYQKPHLHKQFIMWWVEAQLVLVSLHDLCWTWLGSKHAVWARLTFLLINWRSSACVFLSHNLRTTKEVRESIFLNTLPHAWLVLTNQMTAPNIYLNNKRHEAVQPLGWSGTRL